MKGIDSERFYENIAEIYDKLVVIDDKQTNEEIEVLQQLLKENWIKLQEAEMFIKNS